MNPLRFLISCIAIAGVISCGEGMPDPKTSEPEEPEEELVVIEEPIDYDELDWKDQRFFYKGNPFTGTTFSYHDDGETLRKKGTMRNGVYHGVYREWWENGQMQTETNFTKGIRHGDNTYWDKDGSLIKEQVYDMGESVKEKYHQ